MKIKFLSMLFAVAFVGTMNADCTLKTPCGDVVYEGVDGLLFSRNADLTGPITVKDSEGNLLEIIECDVKGAPSVNCSVTGGGGDDICDLLPASIPDFIRDQICDN